MDQMRGDVTISPRDASRALPWRRGFIVQGGGRWSLFELPAGAFISA